MGFWRTIDRLRLALAAGQLEEARRLLRVAVAQHRGPYEESSIRSWQEQLSWHEQIDRAKTARERKTA